VAGDARAARPARPRPACRLAPAAPRHPCPASLLPPCMRSLLASRDAGRKEWICPGVLPAWARVFRAPARRIRRAPPATPFRQGIPREDPAQPGWPRRGPFRIAILISQPAELLFFGHVPAR